METAIVYVSYHHENTKKLVGAISKAYDVIVIDGLREKHPDLSVYDCIGFASGIDFGKFYPQMMQLMESCLPEGKKVFYIFTCGSMSSSYTNAAKAIAKDKNCNVIGEYGCLGYDTYGPFKLMGGIAKGHPDEDEIAGAVKFYGSLMG